MNQETTCKRCTKLVQDVERLETRVAELEAATLRLCRELQCPAMEYLNREVQNAWTAAFDLVDPRAALKGAVDGQSANQG